MTLIFAKTLTYINHFYVVTYSDSDRFRSSKYILISFQSISFKKTVQTFNELSIVSGYSGILKLHSLTIDHVPLEFRKYIAV